MKKTSTKTILVDVFFIKTGPDGQRCYVIVMLFINLKTVRPQAKTVPFSPVSFILEEVAEAEEHLPC